MNLALEHAINFTQQAVQQLPSPKKTIEVKYIESIDQFVGSVELDKLNSRTSRHLYWKPF